MVRKEKGIFISSCHLSHPSIYNHLSTELPPFQQSVPPSANVTCRVRTVIRIRVNPRIEFVSDIARVRSHIRAAHTSRTTSTSALDTHVAGGVGTVIHVRINPGV